MGHVIGHGRRARETYPDRGAAGASAAIVPLSRQKFIDGDTTQAGLNGAASEPFKTIAQFIASRTNVSVNDATANYVGWLMPAAAGYTEDVHFPPGVSTELRADSYSFLAGTRITGNVTWANGAGAHSATDAVVNLHNISISGLFTIDETGGGTPPTSIVVVSNDEKSPDGASIVGGFDASTTVHLAELACFNVGITGACNLGTAATSAVAFFVSCSLQGNISAKTVSATSCSILVSAITVNASAGIGASLTSCVFQNPCALTAVGTVGAVFDGPSWRSFQEAGGTRTTGTTVLVVGGSQAGRVAGAALPATGTTNVSLNGVGATAGYTGSNSGNHYSTPTDGLTGNSVVVLKTGGGESDGDTITITRPVITGAFSLTVENNAGAAIGIIPPSNRGFVTARYSAAVTDWVFLEGGALAG